MGQGLSAITADATIRTEKRAPMTPENLIDMATSNVEQS
jgi:hypothetical protein